MSNQYRLEQDRDLLLLLDAGRLSAAPLGPTGVNVLDARATVAAQIRAAGARVLEAPPDRLPATVVAAYLRAKSRAVL